MDRGSKDKKERRRREKHEGIHTETPADAVPRSITERNEATPAVREFARCGDSTRGDPTFGFEDVCVLTPDFGVGLHGSERNVEDLRVYKRVQRKSGSTVMEKISYSAGLSVEGGDLTTIGGSDRLAERDHVVLEVDTFGMGRGREQTETAMTNSPISMAVVRVIYRKNGTDPSLTMASRYSSFWMFS